MKEILIVESSQTVCERLCKYIRQCEKNVLIHKFDNLNNVYELIMRKDIELFIINIDIDEQGKHVRMIYSDFVFNIRSVEKYKFTPIIVLSRFHDVDNAMYKAAHIYGYFEQPYKWNMIKNTIYDAMKYPGNVVRTKYMVRNHKSLCMIDIDDVIYLKRGRAETLVVTSKNEYRFKGFLIYDLINDLKYNPFIPCFRGMLVNRDYILKIDKYNNKMKLLGTNEIITIGETYKKSIIEEMVN